MIYCYALIGLNKVHVPWIVFKPVTVKIWMMNRCHNFLKTTVKVANSVMLQHLTIELSLEHATSIKSKQKAINT
jgi:hypothetical protein